MLVVGFECSLAITCSFCLSLKTEDSELVIWLLCCTDEGELYSWGNCKDGRLGNNLEEGFIVAPTKVNCKLNFK
jgi:hypothetical protein